MTMLTRKTGHVDTVGTLDLSDDTMGGGLSRDSSNGEDRVAHIVDVMVKDRSIFRWYRTSDRRRKSVGNIKNGKRRLWKG